MKSSRIILTFLCIMMLVTATAALGFEAPKVVQTTPINPQSAIFIGNSFFYYNNSMHGHVRKIVSAADKKQKFRATSVTISGSGLDWHDVDSYFRPNAIGRYSFVAGNKVKINKLDKLFDVAIMMGCSQCPVNPDLKATFVEFAKKHSDTVRKHDAEPIFFMTWAYADKPDMTEQLADAYIKAANANGAMVIPAGLAFAKSIAIRPDLNLYAPDKRHPSLMGTYLGANVIYASLFKKSPIGNSYTADLDPSIAKHLQTVAWDTVKDFFNIP